MSSSPNIAALAAPLADPARARMVTLLMDGRARTVTELGAAVGLTKASASEHATRLVEAGFLKAERQGRHKYLALSGPEVAGLIEAMMALAGRDFGAGPTLGRPRDPGPRVPGPRVLGPRDPDLRAARLCYNHLAGSLGVRMYQSLSARGFLLHQTGGLGLSDAGRAFAIGFGLDRADLDRTSPPLCRDCLDWSERQSHLGGRLGRLVLARMEALDWLRRRPQSRALTITPKGQRDFARAFPLLDSADPARLPA